jgi:hypothetical protein
MHIGGARQAASFKKKDHKNVSHSCSRLIEMVYMVMASEGERTIRHEAVRMLRLTSS